MNDASFAEVPSLDPALVERIDDICDRFEAAWQAREEPNICEFLDESSEPLRSALLKKLLLLELHYRDPSGETMDVARYHKLFPEHVDLINSLFSKAKAASGDASMADTANWSIASTQDPNKPETPADAAPQEKQFGRFKLQELLGRGGFGSVHRAYDPELHRDVALKFPRAGTLADENDVQRFLREARAAAQLRHPNIVPVYEAGEIDGTYFIASSFVTGSSLREAIKEKGQPSHREAATLIAKLAEALHYAHNKGVIHRDMKPENVMIDDQGEPHIMDFGLARRESGEELLTQEGALMGTPAYMSPEQAKGESHTADARTDLWALGVMLYELLTGNRPFSGHGTEILVQITRDDPESPRKVDRSIPKDLETICLKCLAKDPEARYPSCQHLTEELERWLRDEPIQARPISTTERTWRWCRRRPAVASLLCAMAASLVVGACVSTYFAIKATRLARVATRNASDARNNARRAEENLDRANAQRKRAERNEQRALASEATTRRSLYFADVNLAQQALHAGDVERCIDLLEAHRPSAGKGADDLRGFEWYYLWRQSHGAAFEARWEHPGDLSADRQIRAIAFSPDGRTLAMGGGRQDRGKVRFYKWPEKTEIASIDHKNVIVTALAYSSDGELFCTATGQRGRPGTINVWRAKDRKKFRTIDEDAPVMAMAFSPVDQTVLTGTAQLVKSTGRPVDRYFPVNANEKRTATAKLWNADTGELLVALPGQTADIFSVAWSPNGKIIAAGDAAGKVHLWDAETREPAGNFLTDLRYIWSLEFSPDGKTLAAGAGYWNEPGTVLLWDVEKAEVRRKVRGHSGGVTMVAFASNGKTLATGSWDRTIKLWDIDRNIELNTCYGHTGHVWTVHFAPGGRTLVSGGWSSNTSRHRHAEWKTWNLKAQRRFVNDSESRSSKMKIEPVCFGDWAGGTAAAAYPDDKMITIWDAQTGEQRAQFQADPETNNGMRCVAVSPDGKLVAAGGFTKSTKIWDGFTGEIIDKLETDSVPNLKFSPDGSLLAVACDNGMVHLWDVRTGRERPPLIDHTDVVWDVDFTPNGERLASASWDGTVKIWNPGSGRLLATLQGNNEQVWWVAFLNNGRTLLGTVPGAIGLWDGSSPGDRATSSFEPFENIATGRSNLMNAARSYVFLATVHDARDESDLAERAYQNAIRISEHCSAQCSAVPVIQRKVALHLIDLARLCDSLDRSEESQRLLSAAEPLSEQAVIGKESTLASKLIHVELLYSLATYAPQADGNDVQDRRLERAHQIMASLVDEHPAEERLRRQLENQKNNYAWRLVLSPPVSEQDTALAVDLARSATAQFPDAGAYWNTLGVALYRAGQWQEAINAMKKSCDLRAGGSAHDWYFLAMAYQRIGDEENAASWYDKARQWANENRPLSTDLTSFADEAAKIFETAK